MDVEALLAAYDAEVRPGEWKNLPAGVNAETDGPVVRVLGFSRGFISPPPVLELDGEELSSLIRRQREVFAGRGEAVEWKTRGHDLPKDIVARLLAEGFLPEDSETVLIGDAAEMARQDAPLPPDVAIRETSSDADLLRIGEMESEVWVNDKGWDADDLIRNVHSNPDQVAVFVAEASDRVVSAGWLEHAPGSRFAGLWGVRPWSRGVTGASIGRLSPDAPFSPCSAARLTSRSMPQTTAAQSLSASDSSRSRRRPPTCGDPSRSDGKSFRPSPNVTIGDCCSVAASRQVCPGQCGNTAGAVDIQTTGAGRQTLQRCAGRSGGPFS